MILVSNTGDKTLRDVCSLKPTNKKRSVAAASEEPSNCISKRLAKIFTLSDTDGELVLHLINTSSYLTLCKGWYRQDTFGTKLAVRFRCHVSGARFWVSGVTCHMSLTPTATATAIATANENV